MANPEKTEPATSHKKGEARRRGQVAKSIELNTAFVLIVGFIGLRLFSGSMYRNMELVMRTSFNSIGTLRFTPEEIMSFGLKQMYTFVLMIVPFILLIAIAAVVANVLQVGFMRSWQVVKPQFSRINPIAGMRRFFYFFARTGRFG
jgi:flagellar biosynthesis protein FlhB